MISQKTLFLLRSVSLAAGLVLLVLLISCKKDENPDEGGVRTITGKICESFSTADGTVSLTKEWKTNDKIKILWNDGYTFAQAMGGKTTSKFSVQGTAIPEGRPAYYAVYPSSVTSSLSADGSLVLNFKTGRKATAANATILVARVSSPGETFNFYSGASILSFGFGDETLADGEVRIATTSAAPVGGNVKYNFKNGKVSSTKITGNVAEMTAKLSVTTDNVYYVALPPAVDAADGYAVSFYNNDGGLITQLTETTPADLSRGRLLSLGDVSTMLTRDVVKVLYHNIFLRSYEGSVYPKRKWDNRKAGVVAMLKELKPQVFGLNECDYQQRKYVSDQLGSGYGVSGLGPKGESGTTTFTDSSNPIFYEKSSLTLDASGSFWLSDTPGVATYTWGHTSSWYQYRYCNWCRFTHKASGKKFAFFVTHLANGDDGLESRQKSLPLLKAKIAEIAPDMPVVIGGDFNSSGSETYYADFRTAFKEGRLDCVKKDAGKTHLSFKDGDFVNVSGESLLDHIFYQEFDGLEMGINRESWADIKYISDHYPVWARLRLTNN